MWGACLQAALHEGLLVFLVRNTIQEAVRKLLGGVMDIQLKYVHGKIACDECAVPLEPLLDGWWKCSACQYCFLICGDERSV